MKWASLLLFIAFSDPLSPGVQHILLLIWFSIRWQSNILPRTSGYKYTKAYLHYSSAHFTFNMLKK